MEEVQARHRKELKDLQGRITQKKKNATKKTRKGVVDECERLEQELKDKQQAEIDALNGEPLEEDLDQPQDTDTPAVLDSEQPEEHSKQVTFASDSKAGSQHESEEISRARKPNRQKARLARRAAEQEAQAAAAAEDAAKQPDLRQQEMTAMDTHKKKLKLNETFIQPDGHCLFSACAKGLSPDVVKDSGPFAGGYQNVRYATAEFMSKHREDFEAFMEEPFDEYVEKIRNTAEWGGQLELQAIAKSYDVTIKVLQADGRVEEIQSDSGVAKGEDLWLAYYRHSFGLGEHYNALQKV